MTEVPALREERDGKLYSVTKQTDHGCEGYSCLWFNQGCTPGCDKCEGPASDPSKPSCDLPASFEPWIKWDQQEYITYGKGAPDDLFKYSPWRSPGEAPVTNSCGLAAGTTMENGAGVGVPPPGFKNGSPGTDLPPSQLTKWTVGDRAEVSFGLWANHGGGYQYRLCPADSSLDEECFQKMPLGFATNKQTLYWTEGPKKGSELEIEAVRLAARDGSVWTKNPIPAFACPNGGVQIQGQSGCKGPQFPSPFGADGDQFWGFSDYDIGTGESNHHFLPYIQDTIVVPDVKAGHYVLSWRWDCEQTPQIWNSCADILITRPDVHV